MAHISVVTPVYRAEGCLEELYRRLLAALSGITQDFEIIMVEDCGATARGKSSRASRAGTRG